MSVIKPVIRKLKNLRGRITGYSASLGRARELRAEGKTKAEAVEVLGVALDGVLERFYQGTTIGHFRGHPWVVWPTLEGWRYWISGCSPNYTCEHGGLRHDACEAALRHLAQTLWDFPESDQEFVDPLPVQLHADLLAYFKWQREYRRLTVERGYSDHRARQILGGFEREEPVAP